MSWAVRYRLTDGLVPVGDHAMPRRLELLHDAGDGGPQTVVALEVIDGAAQCRSVTVTAAAGGREVRSSDLRAVRVDDLIEYAAATAGMVVVDREAGSVTVAPVSGESAGAAVLDVRSARRQAKRKITDAMLREVAEVYRAHVDDRPTEAVAERFDRSLRTASLYVQQARQAGYLGAAVPGKAGEQA